MRMFLALLPKNIRHFGHVNINVFINKVRKNNGFTLN